jgi:hypothetical protein
VLGLVVLDLNVLLEGLELCASMEVSTRKLSWETAFVYERRWYAFTTDYEVGFGYSECVGESCAAFEDI